MEKIHSKSNSGYGMLFAVVVAALIIGGWLYYNSAYNKTGISSAGLQRDIKFGERARIVTDLNNIRKLVEIGYGSSGSGYSALCSDGLIDDAIQNLSNKVNDIIEAQGAKDQSSAGIICVSNQDKYAIQVDLSDRVAGDGISSYCFDSGSTQNIRDNRTHQINTSDIKCASSD